MAVATKKREPLIRPLCDKCGSVMVVYTTRKIGTSTVRYFRCWKWPKCRNTKRLDGG